MTTLTTASPVTAHALHERIVTRGKAITLHLLALAEDLAQMRDQRLYQHLGHPTFEDYLAEAGLGISRSQVFKLLRVRDIAVLRGWSSADADTPTDPNEPVIRPEAVEALGVDKTDLIRRALLDAPTAAAREEWVAKALTLSTSDLRRELAAERGMDVDAAWRETTEYAARRLFAFGNRLMDARDRAAARAILDDVVACVAGVREQLEGSR